MEHPAEWQCCGYVEDLDGRMWKIATASCSTSDKTADLRAGPGREANELERNAHFRDEVPTRVQSVAHAGGLAGED